MKHPNRAIEAIEILVGSDFGMDMELLLQDKKKPKNIISNLRKAAQMITTIYCITHAENSNSCNHPDWEKIKYEIIKDNLEDN